jgi:hypothetical protein
VWPWQADRNQAVADSATAAMIEALQLLVPDPQVATIGLRSDGVPVVWLLADQGLYVIGCDSIDSQRYQARVKSRRLRLDPINASVEVTSLLETIGEHKRGDLVWAFTIGTEPFELITHPGSEDYERYTFAFALAAELGWKVSAEPPVQ